MADAITQPGIPGPVRLDALEHARARIGQREQGGRNLGPICEWSKQGLTTRVRDPLPWCAFFVCQCVRQVLQQRGRQEQLARWLQLASGSCDQLWARLSSEGWTWRLDESKQEPANLVHPGDLVFFGSAPKKTLVCAMPPLVNLTHVEFADSDGHTIGGNAGPKADRVWGGKRSTKGVWGYARIPW